MPLSVIKHVHITLAALTLVSFSCRGIMMLRESAWLQKRWVKLTPHIVDTLLLATGLWLAISLYGAFYRQTWLVAKLLAVLLYVVAGRVALRTGRSKTVRGAAFAMALLILAYIISVAVLKSPLPFPRD